MREICKNNCPQLGLFGLRWMCCKCCIITLSGHCSMIIFSSERLQSILHFCRNLLLRSGQGLKSELVDWQNALINFVQLCLCCTFSPSFSPWQQSEPRQDTYVIFDSTDYRLQTALLGLVVSPSHADWSQPGQPDQARQGPVFKSCCCRDLSKMSSVLRSIKTTSLAARNTQVSRIYHLISY